MAKNEQGIPVVKIREGYSIYAKCYRNRAEKAVGGDFIYKPCGRQAAFEAGTVLVYDVGTLRHQVIPAIKGIVAQFKEYN